LLRSILAFSFISFFLLTASAPAYQNDDTVRCVIHALEETTITNQGLSDLKQTLIDAARDASEGVSRENVAALLQTLDEHVKRGETRVRSVYIDTQTLNPDQLAFLAKDENKVVELLDIQAGHCFLSPPARRISQNGIAEQPGNYIHLYLADPGPPSTSPTLRAIQQRILLNNYNLILEEFAHSLHHSPKGLRSKIFEAYIRESHARPDNEAEIAAFIFENEGPLAAHDLWRRYESRGHLKDWLNSHGIITP
jgi:hypothetical protein